MSTQTPRTAIVCWACGKHVPMKHARLRCPMCRAELIPGAYDSAAEELCRTRAEMSRQLSSCQIQYQQVEERNRRWGIVRKFPLLSSHREMRRLSGLIESLTGTIKTLDKRRNELAEARYYSTRWFKASRMFLRPDAYNGSELERNPFGRALYDDEGKPAFKLRNNRVEQQGTYGEYQVFELLERALDEGAFGDAELLYRLYVPDRTDTRKDPFGRDFTEELDIVLVDGRLVWVIEVKNLNRRVIIERERFDERYVVSTYPVKSGKVIADASRADHGPGQNYRHVNALRRALGLIDHGAVRSLVVYVDNNGVELRAPQGFGGTWIGMTTSGPLCATDVIRAEEKDVEPVRNTDGVHALAREMSLRFADVDGTKARVHSEQIKARREAPKAGKLRNRGKASRVRHMSGGCGGDKELERMMRSAFGK